MVYSMHCNVYKDKDLASHGFWNPPCLGQQNQDVGSLMFMRSLRTPLKDYVLWFGVRLATNWGVLKTLFNLAFVGIRRHFLRYVVMTCLHVGGA